MHTIMIFLVEGNAPIQIITNRNVLSPVPSVDHFITVLGKSYRVVLVNWEYNVPSGTTVHVMVTEHKK